MPFTKAIIITLLVIGLISIITVLLIKDNNNRKDKKKQNELKYSEKTKENFREIELSHGTPSIFINKEKGFSQWETKDNIFKAVMLRDQENDNIYTICRVILTKEQIKEINKGKIDYDHNKQELHIKGNSINENTETLHKILKGIINKEKEEEEEEEKEEDNIYDLIEEINEINKDVKSDEEENNDLLYNF
jgi:hypothetical protein